MRKSSSDHKLLHTSTGGGHEFRVWSRTNDYAIYDMRGKVIATFPRNPYVSDDYTLGLAKACCRALALKAVEGK